MSGQAHPRVLLARYRRLAAVRYERRSDIHHDPFLHLSYSLICLNYLP